jgi:polysaccharide deacetylase 2 family uncharacterized protein YibQ
MAKQAKKYHTKTSNKKKAPAKKTPRKRKLTKAQKKRRTKRNMIVAISLFIVLVLIGFGYYLGKRGGDDLNPFKDIVEEGYTTENLLDDLAKIQAKTPATVSTPKPIKIKKPIVVKKPIIKKKPTPKPTSQPKMRVPTSKKHKPKLIIIIDDVSTKRQMAAIKATNMKITPSIFPPYTLARHSNVLANGLKHYMIHLPMESGSKKFNTQTKTLMTYHSSEHMQNRVKELRLLFPHAKYVNNHTGSVFTANFIAMKKLYSALKKEGFLFLDSRTIGNSKVRKICHEFGDRYVSRDIFIDNVHTKESIHNQLKKAVKLAKKKAYAVAIGHPHNVTIEAIASAKAILKDVELVYIDELFER